MIIAQAKHALKRGFLAAQASAQVAQAARYDRVRYLRHSSTRDAHNTRENLAAKITERYHNIEKGLSLPTPRPGFAAATVAVLVRLVESYITRFGEDGVTSAAIGALREYDSFNRSCPTLAEPPHTARIASLLANHAALPDGHSGAIKVSRALVDRATEHISLEFFTSRHSTRIFDQSAVADADVAFALAAAATAPAVCNRQFGHIRVWQDYETIQALLEIQGGARGFKENIPALALVTTSLRSYWGPGERNQAWIDGGLYGLFRFRSA